MHHSLATKWSTHFCARRDLRIQANTDRKLNSIYNVFDPITRQNYRIGDLERALLAKMNGKRALSQVLNLLRRDRQFESLSENQLLAAVDQLQRCGILRTTQSVTPPVAATVRAQSIISGFVVWQLRGLQPDALLTRISPHTNAILSGTAVRVWLCVSMLTCAAVFLEFPRLASQSALWQWIVHPVQGSWLFVIFLLTRALHEMGHALVCKRHGIRCPDIGLFLILGAPCVYCDVSESWQLPSRWQRAAVAAAGMYVEIIVATIAAWVWLFTVEGATNTAALQTMFVCSISTLMINANPLMRFDGYFILSDALGQSNLRGRADAIAESRLYRWILGPSAASIESAGCGLMGHLLFCFSWAGWVYRAGMSLAIAGLLVALYEQWNMAWFGRLVAMLVLVSWWGVPSVKLAANLIRTARKIRSTWRLMIFSAVLIGLITQVPLPYRQFAIGWIQPTSMQGVYASANGLLVQETLHTSGVAVTKGQPLFRIGDMRVQQEAVRLEGVKRLAKSHLNAQNRDRIYQSTQAIDLAPFEAAFLTAQQQAEDANNELEKLLLKAPSDGRFMIMPATPASGPTYLESESWKPSWNSPTQIGRSVTQGTILAAVIDSRVTAVLPLNDKQLEWIATGTEVRVRLAERTNEIHKCRVDAIVRLQDASATWRLMNGDLTETAVSNQVVQHKHSTAAYAALVQLPPVVRASTGTQVDAVFIAPSQTLATLGLRWLQQNLRWLAD